MNIDGTNGLACLTKVDRDEKNASTATRVAPLPHLVRESLVFFVAFFFFIFHSSLFLSHSLSLSLSLFNHPLSLSSSSSSRTWWST